MIRFTTPGENGEFAQELMLPSPHGIVGLCRLDSAGDPSMIIGGNNWTENSVMVHQWCAHPSAYSRELVRAFATYIFAPHGANRGVMLAPVREDEQATLALNVRLLGFRVACRIQDGYEIGCDMYLLEQRREDCKWLRPGLSSWRVPPEWLPHPPEVT